MIWPARIAAQSAKPGPFGGYSVGQVGAPGSIYDGYVVSWGDDFERLDIIGPAHPRGRYHTTRTYGPGARTSDTLLRYGNDTDPLHTGHNDSNRGRAIGYDNLRQVASSVVLQMRPGAPAERRHFFNINRRLVGAMLSTAGAVSYYPDEAGTGDVIVEWRAKYSPKAANPAGAHMTLWSQSSQPVLTYGSDEHDIESNSQAAYLKQNVWGNDGVRTGGSSPAGALDVCDGVFHVFTLRLNKTDVLLYIDGVLAKTGPYSANTVNKPQSGLMTNHSYFGSPFEGESFDMLAWMASAEGTTLTVDWMCVRRRIGKPHFAPRVQIQDRNIDFGGAVQIVLPAADVLWGDGTVSEYLQAIPTEENEPGGDHLVGYNQFPPGVSYDAPSRTLTVAPTSAKAGRLNFALYAHKPGGTAEPLRWAVNVGPVINVTSLDVRAGLDFRSDLYAACDCGVLVSNARGERAKAVSIVGLPAGLVYNDTTGLITGSVNVLGAYPVTITTANALGQTAIKTVNCVVAAPIAALTSPSYASWGGPGWFDFGDESTVQLGEMGEILGLRNKRAAGGDLVAGGYTDCLTYVRRGRNGRSLARLTRNVTTEMVGGASIRPRLMAAVTDPVSTMFQGEDRPFTLVVAFMPTDENTGYVAGASAGVASNISHQVALIRRAAAASSFRRTLTTAAGGGADKVYGAGSPTNTPRVVAVRHTGKAFTIWDNSATTKILDNVADDIGAFSNLMQFGLFAALTNNALYAATQGNMDGYEFVIDNTARSDAEVQQAVADMAARWAIPLNV